MAELFRNDFHRRYLSQLRWYPDIVIGLSQLLFDRKVMWVGSACNRALYHTSGATLS